MQALGVPMFNILGASSILRRRWSCRTSSRLSRACRRSRFGARRAAFWRPWQRGN